VHAGAEMRTDPREEEEDAELLKFLSFYKNTHTISINYINNLQDTTVYSAVKFKARYMRFPDIFPFTRKINYS
jgi:hypothetical protein